MRNGNQLGEFLQARRSRIRPSDVGFPQRTGLSRTPGLRREELAALAGVSIDYYIRYIRLEQGREHNPGSRVLDALAAAMRLNEEELAHLYALAAHAASRIPRTPPAGGRNVRPGILLLLETVRPSPAYVLSRYSDVLAINPEGLALYGAPRPAQEVSSSRCRRSHAGIGSSAVRRRRPAHEHLPGAGRQRRSRHPARPRAGRQGRGARSLPGARDTITTRTPPRVDVPDGYANGMRRCTRLTNGFCESAAEVAGPGPSRKLWHQSPSPRLSGMPRNVTPLAVCGLLALTVAACTGGAAGDRGAQSRDHATVRTAADPERPQTATLALAPGHSSAQYRITVPSPAHYEFDVAVTAPASANVSIKADTWYGITLSILSSTRDLHESCKRQSSKAVCLGHFPLLPAQRAGTWTVVASKKSGPAANVRSMVTFFRP